MAVALCCHFPTTQLQLLWLNYGSMTGWSVYVCACALVVITKEPIENRAPSNFLGSDIDTAPQGSFSNYVIIILALLCPLNLHTAMWTVLPCTWTKMRIFGQPIHLIWPTYLLNDPSQQLHRKEGHLFQDN